jgi:hypothetical protein
MTTDTILGLIRAIRDGNADAVLPLADAMEEAGREKDAAFIRRRALILDLSDRLDFIPESVCQWSFELLAENCPACGGDGEYTIYEDVYKGYGDVESVGYQATCDACRGIGVRLKLPPPGHTIRLADHGKTLSCSGTRDTTVRLDDATLAPGFYCQIINNPAATGMLTIQAPQGETFHLAPAQGVMLAASPDGEFVAVPAAS